MAPQSQLTPLNHSVSAARSALIPAGVFSLFINALALVSPIYTAAGSIKDPLGAVLGNSPFTQAPTAKRF